MSVTRHGIEIKRADGTTEDVSATYDAERYGEVIILQNQYDQECEVSPAEFAALAGFEF